MQKHPETTLTDYKEWYVASAVFGTFSADSHEQLLLVEERAYLLSVDHSEDIHQKAESCARSEESSTLLTCDNRSARARFLGIRKIVSVRSHIQDRTPGDAPRNGSELTFTFFRLNDENDLAKFLNGETVGVTYLADPEGTR